MSDISLHTTNAADQTLDESALTQGTTSPFLSGTKVQFAWDSTSLGLFKTCPRLYQYVMLDGWSPPGESVHLRFGAEYHAALEHFDRQIASGVPRDTAVHDVAKRLVTATWDWAPDPATKAGKYKNRDTLLGLVVDYLDHFNPDPAETYIKLDGTPAVELSFRFELEYGPSTQWEEITTGISIKKGAINQFGDAITESPQPYLLCGHLDRVVSFNRQLLVMDRKTTTTTLGAYYFAQYNPHNQMSLYTLAGRIILDAPIAGVIIDAAQIKLEEPNAFARGFTYRTEAQLAEWQFDLQSTLALAETYALNNYWPQNDTSCDKFGGCRFREICKADPHVRDNFLRSDFTKLGEQEKWNPLRSR